MRLYDYYMTHIVPLAIQYSMPLDEFWHGDERLLSAYQKAYMRDKSFTAWANGLEHYRAICIALADNKGKGEKEYPKWSDPIQEDRQVDRKDKKISEKEYRSIMSNEIRGIRERMKI